MTAPAKTPEELAAEADTAGKGAEGEAGADQGTEPTPEELAALADKGKQALDRMKDERNAAKTELAKFKALGLDPSKLQELIGKSAEDAATAEQERVRREAETAALSKANERLVKAELKAAATGKLADPTLAAQDLAAIGVDVSSFDVDDEGNVDSAAISAAIDDLITKRPYLAAQSEQKRFQGGADGGPRGEAGKPQLTEADVKKLAAEGRHEDIVAARAEGRLNTLLGITT